MSNRDNECLDAFHESTNGMTKGLTRERQLEVALAVTMEVLRHKGNEVIGMRVFCVLAIIAAMWGWLS
jgi:hypothetical protein